MIRGEPIASNFDSFHEIGTPVGHNTAANTKRCSRNKDLYSIILLSALISSRQLIEKKRDGQKEKSLYISCVCTYPRLLFPSLSVFSTSHPVCFRLLLLPTYRRQQATISGCVKAIYWKGRLSLSSGPAISKPRFNFSTFPPSPLLSFRRVSPNCFHFPVRVRDKNEEHIHHVYTSSLSRIHETRNLNKDKKISKN